MTTATKAFTSFAVRSQRSGADGSLGFRAGEVVKVEGIFRNGKTFPFTLDKHGHVITTNLDRFYGYNQRKQKGWFTTQSVDISYNNASEANSISGPTTTFSKKQLKHLKKQFEQLDKDKDGVLNIVELQLGMKAMGQNLSRAKTQELMNMVDHDGGGSIEFEEFAEMIRLQLESGRRKTHLQKSKAAIIIQRLIRKWLVHLTLPYPVPGPKLVNWAKVYKAKGPEAARPLLAEAMEQHEAIRQEQWDRLKERNDERRKKMKKKRLDAEVAVHGDNKNNLLKVILLEVFTEVVNQMAINICEEVTGKKICDY